jgi:hypothetical protein
MSASVCRHVCLYLPSCLPLFAVVLASICRRSCLYLPSFLPLFAVILASICLYSLLYLGLLYSYYCSLASCAVVLVRRPLAIMPLFALLYGGVLH